MKQFTTLFSRVKLYCNSQGAGSKTFEVKIKVMLNYELERLLLSYGESVKVVAPQILKEKIKERLLKGWENY